MRPTSKGLKSLSAVLTCVLIVMIAGAGVLLYFEYANRPEPNIKKAFIIVPGLMGSVLTDPAQDDAFVWSADPAWLVSQEEETPGFIHNYMSSFFKFDEECAPIKELSPANTDTMRQDYDLDRFGFGGQAKNLSDFLVAEYAAEDYEVIIFQYDWRESNFVSAKKLESFVNDNAYTNLIFISHGMGGNVVAKYLSKTTNRMKVDLFIPFSAPFLGTLSAIDWLFEKEESLDGYVETQYTELMQRFGMYEKIQKMPSLSEIIPYPAMSRLSRYDENEAPILFNGAKVTYNEIYDYFCSQDFAKTDANSLKPVVENLIEYQRKDYLKIKGTFRHITEFVDTVYVTGTGIPTRYIADINTATGKISSFAYDDMGDGYIWAYSATAGRALSANNVIVVDMNDIDYGGHDGIFTSNQVFSLIQPVIDTRILRK